MSRAAQTGREGNAHAGVRLLFGIFLLTAMRCWCLDLNREVQFSIAPQPLNSALLEFARQTQLQIITSDEQLRGVGTRGVHGYLPIVRALGELLRGSGLSFKGIGESGIAIGRIAKTSGRTYNRPDVDAPEDRDADDKEIVVTARRTKESVMTVPESVSALNSRAIENLDIQSFNDYAAKIPNLSFSYGTSGLGYAGTRSIAIRGISGTGTTGFYIDETPVPDSIDPLILDVQRIEVLKGPRGTLYGEGSLGGNVRVITNQPSVAADSSHFGAQVGGTSGGGSADFGASAIANLAVVNDTVAVRVVGFGNRAAGFITRRFPWVPATREVNSIDDQGRATTLGGSVSTLFKFSDRLNATARVMAQRWQADGLPATYAPLPSFRPVSYTLDRAANVAEGSVDWFFLPSLELLLSTNTWSLSNLVSYFRRHVFDTEDGTEGTRAVIVKYYGGSPAIGAGGIPWTLQRENSRLNEEVRLNIEGARQVSGVLGARYGTNNASVALSSGNIGGLSGEGLYPNDLGWTSLSRTYATDAAIFGEAYFRFAAFELTSGLRRYWLQQRADGFADGLLNGGLTTNQNLRSSASGINPRLALSYRFADMDLAYVSVSKGFRAGSPNQSLGSICDAGLAKIGASRSGLSSSKPDVVWNYEMGAKGEIAGLRLTGALFEMRWQDIQQLVTIPVCYVTLTANAGAARNRGAELEMTGRISTGVEVRLGVGYDDAVITHSGFSAQPVGSSVYDAPKLTVTVAAIYTRPMNASADGFLSADYSYTGSSVSGTTASGPAAPVRPSYELFNARVGIRWSSTVLSFYGKNLFDTRANLGDINPISYVRRNADGDPIPLVAVAQPREVGVQLKHGF